MSHLALVGPIHPLRGGIALHTARFAQALRGAGHEVEVVSWARQYPGILFPGSSQIDPGPPVCDLGTPAPRALLDSLAPTNWWRTGGELSRRGVDLAIFQRWHPFFAPALATTAARLRSAGTRICWMVHNARPHEGWPSFLSSFLRLGYHQGDRCLVHSASEEEALRSLGVRSEICRVPHPAPEPARLPGRAEARRRLGLGSEPVFLFFGYVRPYKGVGVFLDALERLAQRESGPWSAVIAGEWYRAPSAEETARVGRLGSRVRILNRFLPETEVEGLLASASLVVLPYLRGTQSGVALQAAAAGRPVLVTDVGGLAETVEEGVSGRIVPPGDAGALADALWSMGDGAGFDAETIRTHARSFSWEALAEAAVARVEGGVG